MPLSGASFIGLDGGHGADHRPPTNPKENVHLGPQALSHDTTGYFNTAIGFQALDLNNTGAQNTAIGGDAMALNTSGYANTATGYYALVNNTIGVANTADGSQALQDSIVGSNDTANGFQALSYNTGSDNTARGAVSLGYNTTGNYNTASGVLAGKPADGTFGTGSWNTLLGAYTVLGTGSLTNATAIGGLAEVSQSNSLVLGATNGVNFSTSDTYVGIATTAPTNIFTIGQGHGKALADGWSSYSSRRWKTNIQTLPDALAKVEKLRGVSYDLRENGQHEIGVIAEEVGAVVPEVVTYEANGKDARSVDYSRLTALLIEATKEQLALIREQQKQIRAQQAQMKVQQYRIEQLA